MKVPQIKFSTNECDPGFVLRLGVVSTGGAAIVVVLRDTVTRRSIKSEAGKGTVVNV